MKKIELTQDQVTWVDDWNFEELNQYKWYAKWDESTKGYYAARNESMGLGKRTTIRMHAQIMKTPKGMRTDHINGNTLFNLESNLRICNASENNRNRGRTINNKSGYKGVSWHKHTRKFQSQIRHDGKVIYLGYFDNPIDAAVVYDAKAKELHGEFARVNFPTGLL